MLDFMLLLIRILFFRNTTTSAAWTVLAWLVRLIILSLLLRTYIIPWLLASTSKHIRVRSISPRSIRGLFIRAGVHECRVERITYAWTHVEGEGRINIIIEGVNLALSSVRQVKPARHKRTLTLADLSPSPLAGLLWEWLGDLYAFLEPYVRPYLRAAVVKCTQFFIRWVPRISRAVTFDLHSATITLPDTGKTEINAEKMQLHTLLSLSPVENTEENSDNTSTHRTTPSRPPRGMGAWRKRFREGLERSLDLALGDTRATAKVSLQLQGVHVLTGSRAAECIPLVKLPGKLDLEASVSFNPRAGTMEEQSLEAAVRVGDSVIHADSLLSFLDELKKSGQPATDPLPFFASDQLPPNNLPETPSAAPSANSLGLNTPLSARGSPSFPPLRSPKVPSISVLASPASPFLEVISTSLRSSLRPRRQEFLMPCQKLKGYRCDSPLSFLRHVQIILSKVNLVYIQSSDNSEHTYQSTLQDIKVDVFRSSPANNPLHMEIFGRRDTTESFDPEVYGLSFSVGTVGVERHTIKDVWHLLTIGRINLHALASQWPFPWLTASPFLSSDPNSAVLALRAHVGGAEVTERLEDLDTLLRQYTSPVPKAPAKSSLHIARKPFPRVSLAISCGPLLGSVICKASDGSTKPLVMQIRTAGFSTLSLSHYQDAKRSSSTAGFDHDMSMLCETSLAIEPVFAVVYTDTHGAGIAVSNSVDMDLIYHPTLVSSGALDIRLQIGAMAAIDDCIGSIPYIDTSTLTADCRISGDALCVELWHPDVVATVLQLFTVLPPLESASVDSKGPMGNAAFGFSVSAGLGRFVLLTASPDLNPLDDLGLSRGIALRTTIVLQFCSLGARHLRFLGDLHERSLTRQKLDLAPEIFIDAAASCHSRVAASPPQLLNLSISKFLLRGAAATPFEADDPLIAERDGDTFIDRDFFSVNHAELRMSSYSRAQRKISISIPLIKLDFELLHMYELMLAFRTLGSLQQARSQTLVKTPSPNRALQVEANVSILQISWALPKQKLLTDIHNLGVGHVGGESTFFQFDQARLSTSLTSKFSSKDDDATDTWEEIADLHKWHLKMLPNLAQLEIIASGDNALIRIPYGYVFADLVFDIVVVSKAVRHIIRMVEVGSYHDHPPPEPEPPKTVPQLRISIGHLVLEAEDDPFESRLGLIWRTGFDAVKTRLEREKAFEAKVATIHAAENGATKGNVPGNDYRFDATHTISVQEARRRLDEVHALDWIFRLGQERRKIAQTEQTILQCLRSTIGSAHGTPPASDPRAVENNLATKSPPLFRSVVFDLNLKLTPPSFPMDHLPTFLFEQGNLPANTTYSLVVPMHVHFTLSALHASLRDYPLPIFSIPAPLDKTRIACECDTDLVIAEEMGTDQSVDWIECLIVQRNQGVHGVLPLSIAVPKTIMPVKSYANPLIKVKTDRPTTFTWGVSYGPAIQDLMRIIDTLSNASLDDSPIIGFWDKMKLILHWTVRMSFKSEILLHLKGSRDPYDLHDAGAGFVFCWNENTKLLVNRENSDKELVQVISDSLTLAIPDLDEVTYNQSHQLNPRYRRAVFRKVCSKFQTTMCFGVGIVLERTCSQRCTRCSGPPFQRECRIFDFVPHHKVKLEKKKSPPGINSPEDSYSGFRSDFIHLSVSLTSSSPALSRRPNSFHLSTKFFAHFWSWWTSFDGALVLPIRQGSYYPRRIITPKLGRHLATIKYRISVPHLYVMHGYLDDTEETWIDGVTPWVGLKGMIDHFQADFHQRDEEARVVGSGNQAAKSLRRKAFCAAEVVLKGIDLRVLVATFTEPEKKTIRMMADTQRSNYRERTDLPKTAFDYPWYDPTDYIELDWSPADLPKLHILPIGTCPYFAYFKRNTAFANGEKRSSKFGLENSHTCLLNTEPSIYHIQISLAEERITELERQLRNHEHRDSAAEASRLKRMIVLLDEYISLIRSSYMSPDNDRARNYLIPSETVSPYEWADFDNVYQVHSPTIYFDAPIRDILLRYYHCSRARRSFEYHLATRAVKFIRDQANAAMNIEEPERSLSPTQVAATALRKILKNDNGKPPEVFSADIPESLDAVNPLDGWSDGVSLHKSHYCLLLKSQVVFRGELDSEPCVVATIQAKLQSFAIMDDMNFDDPVSGKVMTRNYAALLGLQAFSPSSVAVDLGRVPLEVLVDLKCESDEYDRLVPQTDAMFHYDKFNRLRLRNNINSAVEKGSKDGSRAGLLGTTHLRDQMDLLRIHIPRFAVSASDKHFQCIANIVTELILFSDAAHKTRLERLENLLIKYDFSDLCSAAGVVENLQYVLRSVLENERHAQLTFRQSSGDIGRTNHLQIRARSLTLAEELNLLFDAIRLAQDKSNVISDRKSALLLQASSSVMSWNMLADGRDLISKLEVQETNFSWLSRQDGSTVNNLRIGNLEAFDGSQHALWAEILSKHSEPANHPLLKRGLLLTADWVVLSPVGGITVYETFELSLHPIRLQIDSRVGRRIMEYLWPARKDRYEIDEGEIASPEKLDDPEQRISPTRTSLDSPRALQNLKRQQQEYLGPPIRKLAGSSSFTDLRSSVNAQSVAVLASNSAESLTPAPRTNRELKPKTSDAKSDVAAEMRTRSGQKTFILVRIDSLNILLSVSKEGSFECRDAHLKTRQLEYRNKTWSFEELVDQFIPSNMNWRGWVKMALQQPLLPVFPVARELFMKTKFSRSGSPAITANDNETNATRDKSQTTAQHLEVQRHGTLRTSRRKQPDAQTIPLPMTVETAGTSSTALEEKGTARTRVLSIFGRGKR